MRGPCTSKHCVTNMAADEELPLLPCAAIFLLNKGEEKRMETIMDLPRVLEVLFTNGRRQIPRITGYAIRHQVGFLFATFCSFCPSREQNGWNGVLSIPEWKCGIKKGAFLTSHFGHSRSRIVIKKRAPSVVSTIHRQDHDLTRAHNKEKSYTVYL